MHTRFTTKCLNQKVTSHIGLFFVVFVWGCSPLLPLELYKYYSPAICVSFSESILLITYILICGKHLKEFNVDYLKVGLPTGFFLARPISVRK